jgi:hypothetical protein
MVFSLTLKLTRCWRANCKYLKGSIKRRDCIVCWLIGCQHAEKLAMKKLMGMLNSVTLEGWSSSTIWSKCTIWRESFLWGHYFLKSSCSNTLKIIVYRIRIWEWPLPLGSKPLSIIGDVLHIRERRLALKFWLLNNIGLADLTIG